MFRRLSSLLSACLVLSIASVPASGQDGESLPREHVIDAHAIGEGLCVHNLFQSNMVLQRDKPVAVWGWASPGEVVTVSFAGQTREATAAEDRLWKIELDAMPANAEPQVLTVAGKHQTLTLDNILVGDVWVLGGQSNMEFPLSKVENGHLEIVSANYPGIRILTVPAQNGPEVKLGFPRLHEWSDWSKRHFRKGDWDVCSPEVVRELSAIGYVFARRIHMAAQIPIGVIDASRGGTTVETWTPRAVLDEIDTREVKALLEEWEEKVSSWDPQADLERRIEQHENWVAKTKAEGKPIPESRKVPTEHKPGPAMDQNRPGNCYASMIAPIAGFAVKGAVFHQGFNNALGRGADGAALYYQVFGPMITAWREAFQNPEMPFGIISLCTAGEPQSHDDYLEKMLDEGVFLREAQYRTFLDFREAGDEDIGFASSYDKRRSWYHPQLKLPVGERISRWALATQYGFESDIRWMPPMVEEMTVEDGRILLQMSTAVRSGDDGPIVGFAIAGEDRRFQPAEAAHLITGHDDRNRPKTDRATLVLTSPHVPNPIHYRYAWGRNPMGNVQTSDRDDLPLATQRSDDWTIDNVPIDYVGEGLVSETDDPRRLKSLAKRDLSLDDLGRRLSDARRFIEENEETYQKNRASVDEERARARAKLASESP